MGDKQRKLLQNNTEFRLNSRHPRKQGAQENKGLPLQHSLLGETGATAFHFLTEGGRETILAA